MAVLVTGGAGYIGSVVVEDLRLRGEKVVVIDNLKYGHRGAIDKSVPFYEGNIGNKDLIQKVLGWNPKFNVLEQIIESVWKWHEANPKGCKNY